MINKCKEDNCDNKPFCRGWCRKHYMRWWTHGDPSIVKNTVPPTGAIAKWIEDNLNFQGHQCLLWPFGTNGVGYGVMIVDGKRMLASRFFCQHRRGMPPTIRHQAAHSCGNGHLGCVNGSHLDWKLPIENQADRIRHGTLLLGERSPASKLTWDDVREIRGIRGVSHAKIGVAYGVSQALVSKIIRGVIWKE